MSSKILRNKIPCGGFYLDDMLNVNDSGELSINGGTPYQQLVTDGNGNTKWEDRLAYDDSSKLVVDAGDGVQLVKVSDEVPSWASIDAPTKVWVSNGTSGTLPPEGNTDLGNGSFVVRSFAVFIAADNTEFGNIVFPEKGVYFAYSPEQYISGIASADSDTPEITWDGNIGIKKIDEKYLPDTIATKADVEVAQTAAVAAQTAADKNKETLSQMLTYVLTFTFDKQTSGRDTFGFNAYNYYKISDFNPSPDDVISFTGTREPGANFSTIVTGNNCVQYGLFIVVASTGVCSLPLTETVTDSFTAPSVGLYACYSEDNPVMTAGTGKFTLRVPTGSLSSTSLLLKSSTDGSDKQFRITVDDSGTISATEVTS